ncbi:isochorismatase family protein [Patescibacteria group bacterium]|nr:isochorismatase family protein [Patescibacteria group bacterium]
MHQRVEEFDRERDALVINDMQNDFLSRGRQPTLGTEKFSPYLAGLARRYFKLENVFFFAHKHHLTLFPDQTSTAVLKHAIATNPVRLPDGFFYEVPAGHYELFSDGYLPELPLAEVYRQQLLSQIFWSWYDRESCPLLGAQFSIFQKYQLDMLMEEMGVRRIFFAGLHLEYCIMDEIAYLLTKGVIRDIVILEDLVRPWHPSESQEAKRRLESMGVQFAMTPKIFPLY